ncbi:MAG: hypothetical protein PHU85_02485, partial [Phycisphaerae bacterium]|nr:hypothetical protein [Phycisphaerae bacterium]
TQPATQPDPPDPMTVADYAARSLETLTGKDLGYISNRSPAEREKLVARWRQIVAADAGE